MRINRPSNPLLIRLLTEALISHTQLQHPSLPEELQNDIKKTGSSVSKYKPHIGAKQRAKGLKRLAKLKE